MKHGVLFINIGSPASLTRPAVGRYLRKFLSDKRVIDIPWLWRFILVNLIIVPFRTKNTWQAYRKIWQKDGSPLVCITSEFIAELRQKLPAQFVVADAARYGNPSIAEALNDLHVQKVDKLTVVPAFPQYSSAANGSALEEVLAVIARWQTMPSVETVNYFYDKDFYLRALSAKIEAHLSEHDCDYLLFSYHGLPERQLPCDRKKDCCSTPSRDNKLCYRFQCLETTRLVAERLELEQSFYRTAFQSRLGRTPWIRPYSDHVIKEIATTGKKNLAVVCPSFVADCLETLEEVGIRLRADFLRYGGKNLTLVPCLNSDPRWVTEVSEWLNIRGALPT